MTEERQMELKIRSLQNKQIEIYKEKAKNINPIEDYEAELNKLRMAQDKLQLKADEALQMLKEHKDKMAKFIEEREHELEIMFKYGDMITEDITKRGFTFHDVHVVNKIVVPEDGKYINLFFHWVEDRRGRWMMNKKNWTMQDLHRAIGEIEQEYEYDTRGR